MNNLYSVLNIIPGENIKIKYEQDIPEDFKLRIVDQKPSNLESWTQLIPCKFWVG